MQSIRDLSSFLKHNINGGIILMFVAILAMIITNSSLGSYYLKFLDYPIYLTIGDFSLGHNGHPLTISSFINDCLMAVFFFHVGLEVKKEFLVGELSSIKKAMLPIIAAIGGIIVPVIVYLLINNTEEGLRGAVIPMATDIAFALGVLSMLGKRVPIGLKVFLITFAVVDDICGILIIAIFYTVNLQIHYLVYAFILLAILFIAGKFRIQIKALYVILGIVIWYLFLQSGVHSTIAGVLVAFTIPTTPRMKISKYINRIKKSIESFSGVQNNNIVLTKDQIKELKNIESASDKVISPLQYMEDKLNKVVNYFILPLFAFANAGVVLGGSSDALFGSITFAVALGLIIGKPIGIYLFSWLSIKLKLGILPSGVSWKYIFGVSCLGGIGFTVSLFIANLAFGSTNLILLNQAKLGIILGTVISGFLGYFILRASLPKEEVEKEEDGE